MMKKANKNNISHGEINLRPDQLISNKVSFAVSEAYKTARTNLQFVSNDDGCNIIAFTSSVPSEGKTVTCINMAICFAQNGKRVLLIDSDMRKPQIASALKVNKAPGLSDLLAGFVKMSDAEANFCRQKTNIENLDVISAGNTPPNPSELLAGNRLKKLLEKLSPEYDYIMIDTPPTLVVTDAMVLKPYINGYVIVVRSDVSGMELVKETVGRYKQIDAKICGFILNGHKSKTGSRYGRYGRYGKYGKYGNYGSYGHN